MNKTIKNDLRKIKIYDEERALTKIIVRQKHKKRKMLFFLYHSISVHIE